MVYKEGSGWGPIEFVKDPYLRTHVGSSALNYGQSVFEGLKAFRSSDGSVRVFRPDMNAVRINHSADVVSMPPIPEQSFLDCVELAVAKNLEFVRMSILPFFSLQLRCCLVTTLTTRTNSPTRSRISLHPTALLCLR